MALGAVLLSPSHPNTMQTLSRGQRLKLYDIDLSDTKFTISFEIAGGGLTVKQRMLWAEFCA